MNEAEIRRQRLLQETRERYYDSYKMPAVHPRYRSAYQDIYGEKYQNKSTFGFRILICIFLFTVFITIDTNHQKVLDIGSEQIKMRIETTWFLR